MPAFWCKQVNNGQTSLGYRTQLLAATQRLYSRALTPDGHVEGKARDGGRPGAARVPAAGGGSGRSRAALGVQPGRRDEHRGRHGQREQRVCRLFHGTGGRWGQGRGPGRYAITVTGRLDDPRPRPVRAAGPPGRGRLYRVQATVRPAVRLAAPGRHRLLPQPARRGDLPRLRPHVRRPGRRPVRRAQLRGLVLDQRPDHRRDPDVRGERQREHRHRRRGDQADRLLQRAGRARPRGARRIMPDGRHRRPHPGRRHRGGIPRLRADQ